MKPGMITLDVREDIRAGRHPFAKIQTALDNVARGETLRLFAPFEPVPLFAMAASKGFGHKSRQMPDGDWEVIFDHEDGDTATLQKPAFTSGCGCSETPAGKIIDVDARGLEPPQPMVRILEALAGLRKGDKLRALTDRRPVHLYPHLEERGFVGESEEQKDGSFITHIRHA